MLKLSIPIEFSFEIKSIIESYGLNKLWKVKPNWDSDICWLSPNSLNQFRLFNDIFITLNIQHLLKDALKLDFNLVMYCGFIVKRSWCEKANFHTDWKGTGLRAFTLITPLVEEANDLGLNYIKIDSSIGSYHYRQGEAIIFAEGFAHSSMPTTQKREVLLLSYTFGVDDMSYWPQLSKSVQTQSNLIRLPNGDFRMRNLGQFVKDE